MRKLNLINVIFYLVYQKLNHVMPELLSFIKVTVNEISNVIPLHCTKIVNNALPIYQYDNMHITSAYTYYIQNEKVYLL